MNSLETCPCFGPQGKLDHGDERMPLAFDCMGDVS
jgi:hypothetical protein